MHLVGLEKSVCFVLLRVNIVTVSQHFSATTLCHGLIFAELGELSLQLGSGWVQLSVRSRA